MKFIDALATAQTNLRRSKLRTFLTIFAIVIGTFTLAMTTAFGQGLQAIVSAQLQAYSSPNLVVATVAQNSNTPVGTVPAYQGRATGTGEGKLPTMNQRDIDVIKTIPHVQAAYPDYRVNADYIEYGGGKYLVSLAALYPGSQVAPVAGSLPADGSQSILLPYPYIKTFGASQGSDLVGKSVTVHLTNQRNPLKQEDAAMTIAGFSADTVHTPDAFVPVGTLVSLANFQSNNAPTFTGVGIVTDHVLSASEDQSLKSALSAKGYDSQTYRDHQAEFKRPLQIVQYGLDGFAGIALLAAVIGIINTLLMAVFERTQEIGLMKALGMRRSGIFWLFITEALTIGFWGGVIGVGLAIALGRIANSILIHGIFKGITATNLLIFPLPYMLAIIGGALALGVLAGAFPALRAARLDPIDALRHE